MGDETPQPSVVREPGRSRRADRGTRRLAVALAICLLAGAVPGVGATRAVGSIQGIELPEALRTIEVRCEHGAVATAAPEASEAGARILGDGGNAVDAAVAAAFALGVVGPCTSGLGGQTYILVHFADGRIVAIDGSATVPVATDATMLADAVRSNTLGSYATIATPGTVAALVHASRRFGRKSLAEVISPAIGLARYGHRLTPEQSSTIRGNLAMFRWSESLARTFLNPDFDPWEPSHVYCQDDLADTLEQIAVGGDDAFYRGPIAAAIEADMLANGGFVRATDLARLRARELQPVRGRFRGFDVIGFPPPGAGAMVVEALQILDNAPPELTTTPSPDGLHLLVEAARIALLDGFAGNSPLALRTMRQLDPAHAARRYAQITLERALRQEEIVHGGGSPWTQLGTTQVSVVDDEGTVVALTQSISSNTGSGCVTPGLGFVHNSILRQFNSSDPSSPAFPVPGRVPQTTMAPTILAHDDQPFLALGSAGSSRIVSSIVAVVTNLVDRGVTLGEAVAAPRVLWDDDGEGKAYVEVAPPFGEQAADQLLCRGFPALYKLHFPCDPVNLRAFGGVNAVMIEPGSNVAVGVGDPRRFGAAATPCEEDAVTDEEPDPEAP